jgi:ABC-type sugar transport system substrate-binding protein
MRFLRLIALLSLFAASACNKQSTNSTPGGAASKKLVVGFSQIGAESAWRTAETESIRNEAEKRGVDLKMSDAQGKQENQISAII